MREVFARFAAGETMKRIVSDLNRRKVPSPGATWKRRSRRKDGRWLVSALHAILHNERYVGRLVWNRSAWHKDPDTGRRTRRERPESEWIVREIPALIDTDTLAVVQSRLGEQAAGGRGGVARYLLSGLLECALCGSKLIVYGGKQHRYICGTYHDGGPHACENKLTVPRMIAEQLLLDPIVEDLLSPAATAEALRRMRAQARQERPVSRDLAELERLGREGVLSPEVAAPAIAEAKRRNVAPVELPTERAWRETVAEMREILRGDDAAAAREVLRELLGVIRVRPGEGQMVAELAARNVLLATGSGRWIGSGGRI